MRKFFVAALTLLSFTALSCASWFSQAAQGETAQDLPWADIARAQARNPNQNFLTLLQEKSPGLLAQMKRDSAFPFWMDLWGRSINFDEGARDVIVAPSILDTLIRFFEAAPRQDRIVHAGTEHTYGYLFSLLRTSFGFKRARWVEGEIEQGLGIPVRLLDENATEGALLANITYVLASISLRERTDLRPWLHESVPANVHPTIVEWTRNETLGAIHRLTEKVSIGSRTIWVRTDFVPFHRSRRPRGNQALLIYSVLDSEVEGARLISAFPVQQSFVDRALDPEHLGARQPVSTRYNAFVPGMTDSPQALVGSRSVDILGGR